MNIKMIVGNIKYTREDLRCLEECSGEGEKLNSGEYDRKVTYCT
jgi:hypothetical protein